MNVETLRWKFHGSLIGSATGDSLGAAVKGSRALRLEEAEPLIDRIHLLRYTDDTHMMIGISESLIERQGFDADHMAQRFLENYYREPFRGYGSGPPRIFRLMRSGVHWERAARDLYGEGSYGNGSAMRVAPIGLFYHDSVEGVREMADRSSRITHAHELGREGAVLQACAVAAATTAEPTTSFNGMQFLAQLRQSVHHQVYQTKLERLEDLLLNPGDRRAVIAELGNGIEAFNSVPTAIFCFLSHPRSFKEAVLYAVSLGGDADTIAAMTGAIAGAYLGVHAIPAQWIHKLENREYLEMLAEHLWRLRTAG